MAMNKSQVLISIFSELAVNLAAGWFGAILIAPNFPQVITANSIVILTGDLVAGTVCLIAAFLLRRRLVYD